MDIDDVERRLGYRPAHQIATLSGFMRVYNKYSDRWQGCVVNLQPDRRAKVIGLLLEGLGEGDVEKLRQRDLEYSLLPVRVVLADGREVEAAALHSTKVKVCRPSPQYQEMIVRVAKKIGDGRLLANVLETMGQSRHSNNGLSCT